MNRALNEALTALISWFYRVVSRQLLDFEESSIAHIARVAFLASLAYFGLAFVGVVIAVALSLTTALGRMCFF
ncbi:hypothetical protein [Paraburkholderia sp. C35]|uniref:hypothetical protein n=1 Tax=Paraburkholderia sp. C35 TaxID=2126993 RepID=UPI000D6970A4|nr:hypothetical protein [Paraburkholderia sp. C35]